MDSYCATLGAKPHLTRTGKRDGKSGFLGEKIKGSLNNNVLVNQLSKSLKIDQKPRKIELGVAFSVLTSNNVTETLVSSTIHLFSYLIV